MSLPRLWKSLRFGALFALLASGCSNQVLPPETAKRDWAKHPAIVVLDDATDIYAMGDVHGDPDAQIKTLAGAGLVAGSGPYTWAGGKATLIVTGDVIDKGSHALLAIDNFRALEADAAAKGGRVVVTMGNHEAEFIANPDGKKAKEFRKELEAAGEDPEKVGRGYGKYGEWIHGRPFAAIAGEWFFSHAGDAKGRSVKQLKDFFETRFGGGDFDAVASDDLLQARGDWWWDASTGRSSLDDVLAGLSAKHLVYGHQPGDVPCPPQKDRPMETLATCYDGKVFFLDVGMSSAVDPSSHGGLLHIERGTSSKVTAVYPDTAKELIWSGGN